MKKRYFEIYVAGSNGFSAYVSTDKHLGNDIEGEILALAIGAKVIEGYDGKEVYNGAGYVEERQLAELPPQTTINEI